MSNNPGMAGGRAVKPGQGPRLRVGVVSAGRVGAVLGAALRRVGHDLVGVSAVSAASRGRAEELLVDTPIRPPDQLVVAADLVVLAVPDDALAGLVRGLVATGSVREGQIVLHTSGAHGVSVLSPAAEVGALTLALHPVMTFTGRAEDIERLAACCVGVTAAEVDEAAWHVGEALVLELGAEPVRIPEADRALYHAALTHGANHMMTLVSEAAALLRDAGIEPSERVLAPLLSTALDNALRHGDRALTGPVARGDTGTVRAHIDILRQREPEVASTYRALARRTAQRAEQAGLLRQDAAEDIHRALEDDDER